MSRQISLFTPHGEKGLQALRLLALFIALYSTDISSTDISVQVLSRLKDIWPHAAHKNLAGWGDAETSMTLSLYTWVVKIISTCKLR